MRESRTDCVGVLRMCVDLDMKFETQADRDTSNKFGGWKIIIGSLTTFCSIGGHYNLLQLDLCNYSKVYSNFIIIHSLLLLG